ncbi:MAG: F0F1 ATP synthase subunit B [Anaerolineales bacterium]|nr:F0F1 ATP synthase subunit B [Anaerolineales bacterium]
MEGLGINLGTFILQILSFTIVLVVLRKWVYNPVLNALEKRRTTIAKGLEDARVASEARANAEKEAEQIIAKAQAESGKIVREATERAEAAAREVKVAADAEASKAREAAIAEAQLERDRILGDLRSQVAALAMAAAQKLIGETLDEKRQRALINDFFSGVKDGEVVVLEGAALSGASAEVTSALPLTPDEMETVKKDILSKIGSQATVTFRVDPAILGGLVIRAGGKVLDASVSGKLDTLRQSLS